MNTKINQKRVLNESFVSSRGRTATSMAPRYEHVIPLSDHDFEMFLGVLDSDEPNEVLRQAARRYR
ncbi:MAG: hypothetical protein ABMA64_20495 [Myxococcota bacterium]